MRTILKHCALSLSLVVLLIVSASTLAVAQPGNRAMNIDQRIDMMKKNLKISDEQAAKIKPILESQEKEITKIREDNKASREAGLKAAEEREKTFEKEMAAVLTPDQLQKWQSARAKAIDRMKERAGQKPEKTDKK